MKSAVIRFLKPFLTIFPPSISAQAQHRYPNDSQMTLQALAGPMSPKEADIFYQKIKTPPVRIFSQSGRLADKKMTPVKLMLDSRLSDMDKGVERVGRTVARDLKVPWCEYWSFLDEFCDLSSPEGLEKLEEYFCTVREKAEIVQPVAIEQPKATSPLADLCLKLNQFHLSSPVLPETPDDEEFFTPPSTPPAMFYEIPAFYILGWETDF